SWQEKPVCREEGDDGQTNQGEQDDVRRRTQRHPRRANEKKETEQSNDNSFGPFFSPACEETSQHRQQCDKTVARRLSSGDGSSVLKMWIVDGIAHGTKGKLVWESLFRLTRSYHNVQSAFSRQFT